MNVGIVLDEGLPSPDENYRIFYSEKCAWWLTIKATGLPGHGAKLYDNSAMENLLKSIENAMRFRVSQFDLVKAGLMDEGEVVSVDMVFLKAGTPTPTFKQHGYNFEKKFVTATDNSNPWWKLLEGAVKKVNGKIGKPKIFPASPDARYFWKHGLPAIGFSPMINTPVLLYNHNEFLNPTEYLKGIAVYESIIKEYTSCIELTNNEASPYTRQSTSSYLPS